MNEEVRQRAFEPFFTTKPTGKGTGLGLATVHGIVSQSGGTISLRSSPGSGTQFSIFFPASPEQPTGDQRRVRHAIPVGATILLTEDEAPLRELLLRVLVRNGFQVITAANGIEALKAMTTMASIDLLISDVVMPGGVSGPQLAEALRVRQPDLRVLFISGYGDSVLMRQQLYGTATRLLTKPFSTDELLSTVAEMFRVGTPG
ncbi:MAG: response regulator [Oscillochloris sp.]|nr:response regulator [Oscillochloris sp.]